MMKQQDESPRVSAIERVIEQVYSRAEAAGLLNVSPNTVGKLVRSGRLRAVHAGFGTVRQHIRIPASAIEEFLATGK